MADTLVIKDIQSETLAVGPGKATYDIELKKAIGNEVALDLQYTTNKASSGNDTGIVVNQTDTASPGTSLLADFQVGGSSKAKLDNGGDLTITQSINFGSSLNRIGAVASNLTIKSWSKPIEFTSSNGQTFKVDIVGLVSSRPVVGITAHTGSSQGDGPLTSSVNEISVCANVGDAGTLPEALANVSYTVMIINNGDNAMDVFPYSGDNLGAGADTAVSLAAGANITYVSYDATNWVVKA